MEAMLSAAVVSVVLAVLVLISHTLRAEAGEMNTQQTLTRLRAALLTYHANNDPHILPVNDQAALRLLLMDPVTGTKIASLPIEHGDTKITILDGFGKPLIYIPPEETEDRLGDFVSAGLDGKFGDPFTGVAENTRAALDDIYSSDMDTERR